MTSTHQQQHVAVALLACRTVQCTLCILALLSCSVCISQRSSESAFALEAERLDTQLKHRLTALCSIATLAVLCIVSLANHKTRQQASHNIDASIQSDANSNTNCTTTVSASESNAKSIDSRAQTLVTAPVLLQRILLATWLVLAVLWLVGLPLFDVQSDKFSFRALHLSSLLSRASILAAFVTLNAMLEPMLLRVSNHQSVSIFPLMRFNEMSGVNSLHLCANAVVLFLTSYWLVLDHDTVWQQFPVAHCVSCCTISLVIHTVRCVSYCVSSHHKQHSKHG